jgi:hypothetical protein
MVSAPYLCPSLAFTVLFSASGREPSLIERMCYNVPMFIRQKAIAFLVLIACTISASSFEVVSDAGAASRGSTTWSFTTNKVNASSPLSVTYKVTGARAGSSLSFEREFGTAHVWKLVATLKLGADTGTVTLPGDQIGAYLYKARLSTGKLIDSYSAIHPLYSYGNISYLTACNEASGGYPNCGTATIQLQNSTLYNYESVTDTYDIASPGTPSLEFPATSCRSVH